MTGPTLVEESADRFQPLGVFGQPVHQSHVQLQAALSQRFGDKYANFFARPRVDDQGKKVSWISPVEGDVRRWSDLPDEEQAARAMDLQVMKSEFEAYMTELRSYDGETKDAKGATAFVAVLEQALRTPNDGYLYFVGDQPVSAFWGFREEDSEPFETLSVAPRAPVAPAAGPTVVPPPPVQEPERRRFAWWWLLIPLLLLLLILLFWWLWPDDLSPTVGPDDSPVVEEPIVPDDDEPIIDEEREIVRPDGTILRPDGTILRPDGTILRPDGTVLQPDGTVVGPDGEILDPDAVGELPAVEDEVPADVADEQEGAITPEGDEPIGEDPLPETPEPTTPEDVTPPEAPEPDGGDETPPEPEEPQQPEPEEVTPPEAPEPPTPDESETPETPEPPTPDPSTQPPPGAEPGTPPEIPPSAQDGAAGFMQGQWQSGSDSGLVDGDSKSRLSQQYQFDDNGKGESIVRRSDGVTCRGPAEATVRDGNLRVQEKANLRCSDGTSFKRSTTVCVRRPDGSSRCQGRDADGKTFDVDLKRGTQP